jgi:hypothetical protein
MDEEEGKSRVIKNHFLIFFAVIIIFGFVIFFNYSFKEKTCGDGTLYNGCSASKPYFCENGILKEKAEVCGCPENFIVKNDGCFSEYMTEPEVISFNYSLENKVKEINFTVYRGFYEYSKSLPRFLAYNDSEKPSKRDFKLRNINNQLQRDFLIPLVVKIQNLGKSRDEQAKIAASIVQNIPYKEVSNLTLIEEAINYKYPYEVLYDMEGICSEKSDLLVFLLKELGYSTAIFYFPHENHEAVGIKCPSYLDFKNTGYCYIETTSTQDVKLLTRPEVIKISDGKISNVF